jgi:hypothetical protein
MGRFSLSLIKPDGGQRLDSSKPDQKLFLGGGRTSARQGVALSCIVIFGSLIGIPNSLHSQTPADDIAAAQIRSQGYQCDQPITARRNVKLSKPDLPVWTLKCRNAA